MNASDTANIIHGPDIDGNELCGPKTYSISPPGLAYLTFDPSSYTGNQEDFDQDQQKQKYLSQKYMAD